MIFNLKLKNILLILVGSAIMSFGLVHFNMQNSLGEGGFTGITLLIYNLTGISPSITNIVLNIPLFFAGRVPIVHGGGEISLLSCVIKEYDCLRGPPFFLRPFHSLLLVKIERSVRLKTILIIKNVDRYVKLKNFIEA